MSKQLIEAFRKALLGAVAAGFALQAIADNYSGPYQSGGNNTANVPYAPPSGQSGGSGSQSGGSNSVNTSSGTASGYGNPGPTNGGLPPSGPGGSGVPRVWVPPVHLPGR
jgi:hypothetical protein